MTSLYGGTTLGQLAIGVIGTQGAYPFMVVLGLLLLAVLPPLLFRQGQPACDSHQKLSLKKIAIIPTVTVITVTPFNMDIGVLDNFV